MTERWDTGLSPEEEQELKAALERAAEIEANTAKMNPPSPEEEPTSPQAPEEEEGPEEGEHSLGDFERLCRMGYLEKKVELGGNEIVIRTINQDEELTSLTYSERWGPATQARAFSLYCLAQAMVSINRKPWFTRAPVSQEDEQKILEEKMEKLSRLHSPFLNLLLLEYRRLEDELLAKAQYAKKDSRGERNPGSTSESS